MSRIRLDKFISNMGWGSRREVKEWIQQGRVQVNGQVQRSPKAIIDTEDHVQIDGESLAYQEYVYYMLHKPEGVLSATRDHRKTVLDLLCEEDRRPHVHPVGRLDRDTTGLLLLTDDGRLGHALLSPKKKVDKTYLVTLDQPIDEKDIKRCEEGIYLEPEGILTKPARLCAVDESGCMVRLTIHEGKYHQVKRMMHACGKEVLCLHRETMGSLKLDPALEPGQYRPLTEEERIALEAFR